MMNFCTLPVTVVGKESTNLMNLGTLKLAIWPRQKALDGFGVQGHALVRDDPRHHLFAILLTGYADDLHVLDARVGVEKFLDFAGIDVFAAANDHLLEPPGDGHIAVLIHAGDVAGVQPAVGLDGGRRAHGIVVIAVHHEVAAGAELAVLADAERSGRCSDR